MFFILFSGLTVLISYFSIIKVREGAGMSNNSIMRYMSDMLQVNATLIQDAPATPNIKPANTTAYECSQATHEMGGKVNISLQVLFHALCLVKFIAILLPIRRQQNQK